MTTTARRTEVEDHLHPPEQMSMLPNVEHESAGVLTLRKRFLEPPFSILDARQGGWQTRKGAWTDPAPAGLGLKSAEGRTARMLAKSVSNEWIEDPDLPEGGYFRGAEPGTVNAKILALTNGQSIFDPVLCEMFYSWFCPEGGRVLDPYAGGSVRGLVAARLKRYYDGIDLSEAQVTANELQCDDWLERGYISADYMPTWHRADTWRALRPGASVVDDGPYDFVWSCPPYHDLEVYSDNPDDHSNLPWGEFCRRYRETIEGAVDRLAEDRFAAFVIGEIREGSTPGFYRNFMGLTIDAFEAAGAAYYNEAILVTSVGTLPLRTAKQFKVSRKVGKTHQTILVFCKGEPRKAADACNEGANLALAQFEASQIDAVPDDEAGDDDLTIGTTR